MAGGAGQVGGAFDTGGSLSGMLQYVIAAALGPLELPGGLLKALYQQVPR